QRAVSADGVLLGRIRNGEAGHLLAIALFEQHAVDPWRVNACVEFVCAWRALRKLYLTGRPGGVNYGRTGVLEIGEMPIIAQRLHLQGNVTAIGIDLDKRQEVRAHWRRQCPTHRLRPELWRLGPARPLLRPPLLGIGSPDDDTPEPILPVGKQRMPALRFQRGDGALLARGRHVALQRWKVA